MYIFVLFFEIPVENMKQINEVLFQIKLCTD